MGRIRVYGKSFIVILDSQPMYAGGFWLSFLSFPSHSIVIEPESFFSEPVLDEI